jgi:NADPH:quinone reductase-like Zn-dependent oxidoreductase
MSMGKQSRLAIAAAIIQEPVMKAVRIHQFGGPETLKVEELARPEPQPDEVLVRIIAASVNPVDYKIRNGGLLPEKDLPMTLGRDLAGVVEGTGADVGRYKHGDAVYALLDQDRGGYAEFVAVKMEHCAAKPERLGFVQAAAVPLAGLTAWQGLFDNGKLVSGQRVLIHGAAGGGGHFAVQFARAKGATVIATCSAKDVEFVLSLGAAEVIDYHAGKFEDQIDPVDLVYDLVGGETQDRSWKVLKDGGTMVSTLAEPDQAKAAAKHARGAHYMAHPDGDQLAEIAKLIDAGEVTPTIANVFPLQGAAEAERVLESDHVRGKIVLDVALS